MIDIWSLLQPSSLLLLFVLVTLLALSLRRFGVASLLGFIALLIVAGPVFVDLAGRLTWELERQVEAPDELPERLDGILVLGGALDWEVSSARGQLNVNEAAERFMAAAALAQRYPDARLAFTGTYRENLPNDFVALGSDASLIFGEEFRNRQMVFIGEARSTYEDALLALERLAPSAGERWLLVTSAMHMPRALAVFENLGWRVMPYPVDYRTGAEPEWLHFDPHPAEELARLDRAVREWGAILVYERTGRISWP